MNVTIISTGRIDWSLFGVVV